MCLTGFGVNPNASLQLILLLLLLIYGGIFYSCFKLTLMLLIPARG